MFPDIGGFHRQKRACTHVQTHITGVDSLRADGIQHRFGEMQAGRRRGNRSPDMGVERLVAGLVQFLGITIQIRGDGNGSAALQHLRKRGSVGPGKGNLPRLTVTLQ